MTGENKKEQELRSLEEKERSSVVPHVRQNATELRLVHDYHFEKQQQFLSFHRNSTAQSPETMRYYFKSSEFHKQAAKCVRIAAIESGYKISW